MANPSLAPVPPDTGPPHPLTAPGPLWIGAGEDCHLRLAGPGLLDHHLALEYRDRAWWASAGRGRVLLNGRPLTDPTPLRDRDILEIGGGTRFEFVSGEARTRRMGSAAEMLVPPRRRRRTRIPGFRREISVAALVTVVLAAVVLVGGAIGVTWFGRSRAAGAPQVLTDQQGAELDSLLEVAQDHIERGSTLLELGLKDGAYQEFARGVNTLELSDLRNHPMVRPRIQSLAAIVAGLYRSARLAVPEEYADARAAVAGEDLRAASLSRTGFAAAFAQLALDFRFRFHDSIIVTGRDHPEHLALYGPGGAIDLRTRDLAPAELRFIIDECHRLRIRVKDFSEDSILQRQIRSAVAAGLLDRAGTGLHLHIDRFANRRDRWTIIGTVPPALRPRRPGGSGETGLSPSAGT